VAAEAEEAAVGVKAVGAFVSHKAFMETTEHSLLGSGHSLKVPNTALAAPKEATGTFARPGAKTSNTSLGIEGNETLRDIICEVASYVWVMVTGVVHVFNKAGISAVVFFKAVAIVLVKSGTKLGIKFNRPGSFSVKTVSKLAAGLVVGDLI